MSQLSKKRLCICNCKTVLNAGSAPASLTKSVKKQRRICFIALVPYTFTHMSLLRLNDTQQDTDPPSSSPGSGWTVPCHLRDEPVQPQHQSSRHSHGHPHKPPPPILCLWHSGEEEDRAQQHCTSAHTVHTVNRQHVLSSGPHYLMFFTVYTHIFYCYRWCPPTTACALPLWGLPIKKTT